jgi:prevent-host-death family protein
MSQAVSKSKFKPRSLEYFRRVEQTGEALIITDHGHPVLKITPYVEDEEALFRGLRNTVLRYNEPLEPVAGHEWEALQ